MEINFVAFFNIQYCGLFRAIKTKADSRCEINLSKQMFTTKIPVLEFGIYPSLTLKAEIVPVQLILM